MKEKQVKKASEAFQRELSFWLDALEHYSEPAFKQNVSTSGWTIGQLYQHLNESTFAILRLYIPECLNKPILSHEKKTLSGNVLFLLGQFPPIRTKFNGTAPKQPENTRKIRHYMESLKEMGKEVELQLIEASQSGKKNHFILGYLDAVEWFRFLAMHLGHHKRQKRRIDKALDVWRKKEEY
jgi:hypothetical protein